MRKENSICSVYNDSNIVVLQFNDFAILKYPDLVEIFDYINEVYGKERYLKLVDIRAPLIMDDKARDFLESRKIKYRIAAIAVLVGNNTNQDILNTLIDMDSKKTPAKVFVEQNSARYWLNSFSTK